MEGYEIDIQNDIHRRNLQKDARFYNLRHLSESLVPSRIHVNPFRGNARELLLSVSDFRPSNCRIGWVDKASHGWMEYKRALDVDTDFMDLVVQIEDDGYVVGGGKILLINRAGLKGVKALKEAAEERKAETLPGPSGTELILRIEIPGECYCVIDGEERSSQSLFEGESRPPSVPTVTPENGENPPLKKRKLDEPEPQEEAESVSDKPVTLPSARKTPKAYTLKRSMWRVKVREQSAPAPTTNTSQHQVAGRRRGMVLVAVKLEGWTREREYAKELVWL